MANMNKMYIKNKVSNLDHYRVAGSPPVINSNSILGD